jgi:hypothetical protein
MDGWMDECGRRGKIGWECDAILEDDYEDWRNYDGRLAEGGRKF